MTLEELAVIIFEESSSKTRTSKECSEAIKLRTGLVGNFEDTIRRYRQSGSGLELAAKEILGLVDTGFVTAPTSVNTTTGYDGFLAAFKQAQFSNPEIAARICTVLVTSGETIDPTTVTEFSDGYYRLSEGIQVGNYLYYLDSIEGMKESAIESVAEGIYENAWEMAYDQVGDLNLSELIEYAGWYDGVSQFRVSEDNSDEVILKMKV